MNSFEKWPKDGYGFIYKYTSPSGKSYIGQTVRSLKERAKCDGVGYNCCPIFGPFIDTSSEGYNFMSSLFPEIYKVLLRGAKTGFTTFKSK